MYIVAFAWVFVVALMALAEAISSRGSLLGALFTLLLYGALPLAIVLYIMGTPMRRRARHRAEATPATSAAPTADSDVAPNGDACGHAARGAGPAIAAEGEKP